MDTLPITGEYRYFPHYLYYPTRRNIIIDMSDKSIIDSINELVKALEAGGYNATPDTEWLTGGRALTPDDLSPDLKKYPHRCPKCKSPAYLGFNNIDCSNPGCK